MTEALYTWTLSLVAYFILLSAVMNFLPDNSYKKYIQYYMGLLLILVLLSPAFRITGLQEKIDEYAAEFQEQADTGSRWKEQAESWEEEWQQEITILEGEEVEP